MQDEQDPVFFDRPVRLLQERVELVVPALATLLARATFHLESHVFPLVRAHFRDHPEQLYVLLVTPGAFTRLGLLQLLLLGRHCCNLRNVKCCSCWLCR